MSNKLTVGVLYGGRSAEHDVSLQSARNVVAALDRNKYDVVLLGIDRDGVWHLNDASRLLQEDATADALENGAQGTRVTLPAGRERRDLVPLDAGGTGARIDVVFPVLHGPYGEDGTIQGLLKLADIPFVGAGVLGSAVGMDKDVMKRLLRDAGLPIGDFIVFSAHERGDQSFERISERLGTPVFVKPANLGSSVGISKAGDARSFDAAVDLALRYDRKLVVERFLPGREIECSVLGNEKPIASVPGEIVAHHDFYSYEAKYLDDDGAGLVIPAELPEQLTQQIRRLAVDAFKVLNCEGMARVDFFVMQDGEIFINEINTIPGFTRISMYPKLWEASGLPYPALIDRLIELAMDRHAQETALTSARTP